MGRNHLRLKASRHVGAGNVWAAVPDCCPNGAPRPPSTAPRSANERLSALRRRVLLFDLGERIGELVHVGTKSVEQAPEGGPADIELSSLHPGDVCVVGASEGADFPLCHACSLAQREQCPAEEELVTCGVGQRDGHL